MQITILLYTQAICRTEGYRPTRPKKKKKGHCGNTNGREGPTFWSTELDRGVHKENLPHVEDPDYKPEGWEEFRDKERIKSLDDST